MTKPFYKSKKFWATLTGCVMAVSNEYLGLDPEVVTKVMGMISAYVIGQGIADVARKQ